MMRLLLFLSFLTIHCIAQVGPKSWQDHLGNNSSNSVTKLGNRIYASYGNGLIYFDDAELSPQTLNKINGLSDVNIRLLRANPFNNKLLVVYENCNIDVIDANGNITNYPDFRLKTLSGKKTVNEITFDREIAYLACGFGIVIFDTDKLEIKDTYIIGPGASNIEVHQLAMNSTQIFAATSLGVFAAQKNSYLTNYKNWVLDSINLPKGYYCGVVNAGGHIICGYNPSLVDPFPYDTDKLFEFVNNKWEPYGPTIGISQTFRKMGATYAGYFFMIDPVGFIVRDANTGQHVLYNNSFNGESDYGTIRDVNVGKDQSGQMSYWVADARFGLYQTYGYFPFYPQSKVSRNGTNKSLVNKIDIYKGRVAIAPSNINEEGTGNYTAEGINIYENGTWRQLPGVDVSGEKLFDLTGVLLDRTDDTKMWACSWYYGVIMYRNNKISSVYTTSNTNMPDMGEGEPRCAGLSQDEAGNVWVAHSELPGYLSVVKKNGTFQNFQFDGARSTRKTFVDKNNYVWMLHIRELGVTVFKHNNFNQPAPYDPTQPGKFYNYRVLSNAVGNGNLGSNSAYAIAEDKDGKIWIGTAKGIRVFYNPTNLFSGGDFDGQPIKIVQDGNVELLLDNEKVTAIAVDGANNKWVGTESGGAYCFSPDGITQIYHFTKENSPLYSNSVIDINYDETTGDVFFGTDQGVQSFRGVVIAGAEDYNTLYAYPNPVKPGYEGSVLVRGLLDNSIVKVTDESGNLVWETKSTGGQVEWPVRTLSGNRVTSGVYIIYASTTNGELRSLTKVLVVN